MKKHADELKLRIELVPSTSWWKSLRAKIPKQEWDEIRKSVYAEYGHKCSICRTKGRLNCHEVWSFDDKRHIQKLKSFIALCDLCHHIKHMGLAGIMASEGKLDYDKLVEHFMKVNKCNLRDFEKHRKDAFEIWKKRSGHRWHIEFGTSLDLDKDCAKQTILNQHMP